jgi:single-strand DNA-binding protein
LYVAGELQIRTYEKDGIQKQITEIVAETIELLGRKPESQQQQATSAPQPADQSPAAFGEPVRVPMIERFDEQSGLPF